MLKARLVDSWELAPDIRHFVFDVPEMESLAFAPGQFFSCVADVDGQPITRAYSVAAPASGNRFELCLNRVENGHLSPFMFDLKPGDTLDAKGPYGAFTLREPLADAVFVATGTGIAPFRAILADILGRDDDHQYTLIFGVRYENHLLYRDEFERLQRDHANLHFLPTLSRPGEQWTGRTGHVQRHLDEAIGDRRDLRVYACGLKAMVDDVRAILKAQGFDRKQIIYEKYD